MLVNRYTLCPFHILQPNYIDGFPGSNPPRPCDTPRKDINAQYVRSRSSVQDFGTLYNTTATTVLNFMTLNRIVMFNPCSGRAVVGKSQPGTFSEPFNPRRQFSVDIEFVVWGMGTDFSLPACCELGQRSAPEERTRRAISDIEDSTYS